MYTRFCYKYDLTVIDNCNALAAVQATNTLWIVRGDYGMGALRHAMHGLLEKTIHHFKTTINEAEDSLPASILVFKAIERKQQPNIKSFHRIAIFVVAKDAGE